MSQEQIDFFCDETAELNIFARDMRATYLNVRTYFIDALSMILVELPAEFVEWHQMARHFFGEEKMNANFSLIRDSIIIFRKEKLLLDEFSPECASKLEAATVLFMFAVEDWPDQSNFISQTNIILMIDEFSSLYIEFFDRANELVGCIKGIFKT